MLVPKCQCIRACTLSFWSSSATCQFFLSYMKFPWRSGGHLTSGGRSCQVVPACDVDGCEVELSCMSSESGRWTAKLDGVSSDVKLSVTGLLAWSGLSSSWVEETLNLSIGAFYKTRPWSDAAQYCTFNPIWLFQILLDKHSLPYCEPMSFLQCFLAPRDLYFPLLLEKIRRA